MFQSSDLDTLALKTLCVSHEEAWAQLIPFRPVAAVTLQAGQRGRGTRLPTAGHVPSFCLKIGTDCISFLNYSLEQTALNYTASPLALGFTSACVLLQQKCSPAADPCFRFGFGRTRGAVRAPGSLRDARVALFCCLQLS